MNLERLYEELLSEARLPYKEVGEPPAKIQKILNIYYDTDPFIWRIFSEFNTTYVESLTPQFVNTAAVWTEDGKVMFAYWPPFIEEISWRELNFLMQHEFHHIYRRHVARMAEKLPKDAGEEERRNMNIAMDSIINDEVMETGSLGDERIAEADGAKDADNHKLISGGFFFKHEPPKEGPDAIEDYNRVYDMYAKEKDGEKEEFEYDFTAENVYDWMLDPERKEQAEEKMKEKYGDDEQGDGEGGDGDSQDQDFQFKSGMPIWDQSSEQYGQIDKINDDGTIEWHPISEGEAKELAPDKLGMKRKKKTSYRDKKAKSEFGPETVIRLR